MAFASGASAASGYHLLATIALGPPDRWDYVVADPQSARVYVAHGDKLAVIDTATNRVIGNVAEIAGGTHGTAVSAATGQGFTDDGANGRAIAFDLRTLAVRRSIPVAKDADAVTIDPVTGRVFVISGDPRTITVIDPQTDAAVATIDAHEGLEYAVADGSGAVYVAGEEKGDLLKVDARTNRVVARWPAAGCVSPHGLAYDASSKRLFMGCSNAVLVIMSSEEGRVVATVPIGRGNDAVAFDAKRRRIFSSNGRDGTISIYQQAGPDQ